MTWSPNATFSASLADQQKAPVYAVNFSGSDRWFTTAQTTGFSSTHSAVARLVSWDPGGADLQTGTFQLSSLRFALVNDGNLAWDLISTDKSGADFSALAGVIVTMKAGFAALPEASWETIGYWSVEQLEMAQPGEIAFHCVSAFPEFNDEVATGFGENAETDGAAVTAAGTAAKQVRSIENFAAGDGLLLRDPEYAVFTNVSATSAVYNTTDSAYDYYITPATSPSGATREGTRFIKCWWVQGHPVDILARVILDSWETTGTIQTNFPLTATSANWTTGEGMGVSSDLFDTDQWKTERDNYLPSLTGRLVVTDAARPASEIVSGLCAGLGYLYVGRNGKLRFRALHLPLPADPAGITTVNASTSMGWRWGRDYARQVTSVTVRGDYVGGESVALFNTTHSLAASTPGVRNLTIEARWLWSDLAGDSGAELLAQQMLSRFAKGPQYVSGRLHTSLLTLEPGDLALLTEPRVPDTRNATGSAAARMEITAAPLDFEAGGIALYAERLIGLRGGLIAPDATPTHSSASASERETYLFICQDDELMPNGDDGYGWA